MKKFLKKKILNFLRYFFNRRNNNKYYLTIPKEQILTFNIKDNLMFYTKGIKPIFIIRKNNKDLNFFCSLNYLEGNNLHITNYSVNKNDEIKNGINELLKFLSVKKINYQNLTIDLYYENINDNIILNKEIDNVFRELKFKWIKLENLEGGIRYQKMKYINPNYNPSNNINDSILNLTSGLIIYFGSDKMEKIINSKNFNLFNLKILEKIYENKTLEIENIKFYLNDLHYNQCSDLTEIIKLLSLENINIKLPSVKRNNFILYDILKLKIQFESFIPVKIKGKKYIRIDCPIQVLFEKQYQQKFYLIFMLDGNILIIGEFNQLIIQKLKTNNIYNVFKEIYHNIEEINENVSSIYIPEINEEVISKSNNLIENTKIKDIKQIFSFYKISSGSDNKNYSIKILPKENDIILKENYFLSIMNTEIINDYNISSTFCPFLNKK